MATKCARVNSAVSDELQRHKERQEVKRQRTSSKPVSPNAPKAKRQQCQALKTLLAEGVKMETDTALENLKPPARLSVVNLSCRTGYSVQNAFQDLSKGIFSFH